TGGDLQIGALIVDGGVDGLIFLRDPLTPHPHEPDVHALLRVCDIRQVPVATNLASAEILLHAMAESALVPAAPCSPYESEATSGRSNPQPDGGGRLLHSVPAPDHACPQVGHRNPAAAPPFDLPCSSVVHAVVDGRSASVPSLGRSGSTQHKPVRPPVGGLFGRGFAGGARQSRPEEGGGPGSAGPARTPEPTRGGAMKKPFTRPLAGVSLLLAAALIAAACSSNNDNGSGSGGSFQGVPLTGAGSTFAQPIYAAWAQQFLQVEPAAKVNYQAIG